MRFPSGEIFTSRSQSGVTALAEIAALNNNDRMVVMRFMFFLRFCGYAVLRFCGYAVFSVLRL